VVISDTLRSCNARHKAEGFAQAQEANPKYQAVRSTVEEVSHASVPGQASCSGRAAVWRADNVAQFGRMIA
jgi:hypothetical protein